MRMPLLIITAAVGLMGCAAGSVSGPVATQTPLIEHCERLGFLTEKADAGHLSAFLAKHAMVRKVENRAIQLGATHIVWVHQTDHSAAARAYRCPDPGPDPAVD
jgi:hypothetical protein